ncbi:hypothetical protein [Saliphagus sp. LR7]|uniref:hypothetical protein n=1 Tax=Saliphagus sp. LR7 TaxID=2282654 RepID=UPI000DF7ED74|nr:hypothetical protein [Saliphagus sp. LR7]
MPVGAARAGVRSLVADEFGLLVETVQVTDVEAREAKLWGELISLGSYDEADVAFEIDFADELLTTGDRLGSATFDSPALFSQTVDVEPDSDYQFRAVATAQHVGLSVSTFQPDEVSDTGATLRGNLDQYTYSSSFHFGDVLEFSTESTLSVETRLPDDVDADSATLNGELTAFYPDN